MKVADLAKNKGTTGDIGGKNVAVYESDGSLTVMENLCTHLKCKVDWNEDERVWDCPCHGSKFSPTGDLLRGPARLPLNRLVYTLDNGDIRLSE